MSFYLQQDGSSKFNQQDGSSKHLQQDGASGPTTHNADGSAAISVTATATATLTIPAAGTGSAALTGTATATLVHVASSSTSAQMTGTATALVTAVASGTAALQLSGTATPEGAGTDAVQWWEGQRALPRLLDAGGTARIRLRAQGWAYVVSHTHTATGRLILARSHFRAEPVLVASADGAACLAGMETRANAVVRPSQQRQLQQLTLYLSQIETREALQILTGVTKP